MKRAGWHFCALMLLGLAGCGGGGGGSSPPTTSSPPPAAPVALPTVPTTDPTPDPTPNPEPVPPPAWGTSQAAITMANVESYSNHAMFGAFLGLASEIAVDVSHSPLPNDRYSITHRGCISGNASFSVDALREPVPPPTVASGTYFGQRCGELSVDGDFAVHGAYGHFAIDTRYDYLRTHLSFSQLRITRASDNAVFLISGEMTFRRMPWASTYLTTVFGFSGELDLEVRNEAGERILEFRDFEMRTNVAVAGRSDVEFEGRVVTSAGYADVATLGALRLEGGVIQGGNFELRGSGTRGQTTFVAGMTSSITESTASNIDPVDREFGTEGASFIDTPPRDVSLNQMAVAANGTTIIAGYNGNDYVLASLLADGTPNAAFGAGGLLTGLTAPVDDLTVLPDGKLVAAGAHSSTIFLARYNANGSLDTTFGDQGVVESSASSFAIQRSSLTVQPNGKPLITGFTSDALIVRRWNADGTIDTSFGIAGEFRRTLASGPRRHASALQGDGKLVIAASAGRPGQDPRLELIRLLEDGSLDTTFGTNGIVTTSTSVMNAFDTDFLASGLIARGDGKLLVSGGVGTSNARSLRLLRYLPSGELDATFDGDGITGTDMLGFPVQRGLVMRGDGSLFVAVGAYYGVDSAIAVIGFEADGARNLAFANSGIAFARLTNGPISTGALALHLDGGLLVGANIGEKIAIMRFRD